MEIERYCNGCQSVQQWERRELGRKWHYTCLACNNQQGVDCYGSRIAFSSRTHHIALPIYARIWPNYRIREIAGDPSDIAKVFDIAGIDTVLVAQNGYMIGLGERFRQYDVWVHQWQGNYDRRDFTIREAEMARHRAALENEGMIPKYYIYGYATENGRGLIRLYIVKYLDWLQSMGQTHQPRFKETKSGQENFWHESWAEMPTEHIFHEYIPDEVALYQGRF